MKASVLKKTDVEIAFVQIVVPVRYGEEDIPNDFPGRVGDMWSVTVDIDTGQIEDWPDVEHDLFMKVVDGGLYRLLDHYYRIIASIDNDYVPHGVVPGEYGDYIHLDIGADGVIKNWPKDIDVSEFFPAP